MRKENFELKKEIILLKEQLSKSNSGSGPEREPLGGGAAAANNNNQPANNNNNG